MHCELWAGQRPVPGRSRRLSPLREAEGWDGVAFTDSPALSGDPFVAIALAASVTSSIQLSVSVTNPVTRHPAVVAATVASLHAESGGRVSLGVGRGDSALAHIGQAPASVGQLDAFIVSVQTLLRGQDVEFDEPTRGGRAFADRVVHADRPSVTRLRWLPEARLSGKPPVYVVGTGPRVLRVGAKVADRVTLAVGADPSRVRWGVETARAACPEVPVGAYVNVVVDTDVERALRHAAGRIAVFARFAAMHGTTTGPADAETQRVTQNAARSYQLTRHSSVTGAQAATITPAFARTFAIIGAPGHCVARLLELAALGVDRFHVVGPGPGAYGSASRELFVRHVLPAFRDQQRDG